MKVNVYRLTDINTGEVIEGISSELSELGLSAQCVAQAIKRNNVFMGRYKCEIIGQKERTFYDRVKRLNSVNNTKRIDDINAKARELGMSYGEYVARMM